MAFNTPSFRDCSGSVAMKTTYNTIVYDYYPLVSLPDRPIFWDARYSQEWASGKVSYEHNKLLSSGIGNKVITMLDRRILGGNLIFKKGKDTTTSKNTVDFIRKKCQKLDLDSATESLDLKRLAGGSSYFVMDVVKNDVVVTPIGIDQAYVTFVGDKPVDAKIFINFIDDASTKMASRYYIIEHRYFVDGKPKCINKIYKSSVPQTEGAYSTFDYSWRDDKTNRATDVTESFASAGMNIPEHIVNFMKDSGLKFGYEFDLPFKGLGVIHCKASATSLKHPNSKYGDPVLANCYDLLWEYDYAFSILSKDLYVGRAMMFIPDMMNGNALLQGAATDTQLGELYYRSRLELPMLHGDEFVKLPNYDMEWQTPTSVQFDIRAEELRRAMDLIATNIAQNVGLEPSFLTSDVNQINETKTAFEINNDMNLPNLNVLEKRRLLQNALNEFIDEMCNFYGKNPEDVVVCFQPIDELNKTLTADYIVKLRSVNGMSDEMLVSMAYKDLTEAEKDEEVKRIKTLKLEEETEVEKKNLNNMDNAERARGFQGRQGMKLGQSEKGMENTLKSSIK